MKVGGENNMFKRLFHFLFSMDFLNIYYLREKELKKKAKKLGFKLEKHRTIMNPFYGPFFTKTYRYVLEHHKEFNWDRISYYNELDEYTMFILQDYLNWEYVCAHQKLRKEFIELMTDKVNWHDIFSYQKCVDEEFVMKHIDKWLDIESGTIDDVVFRIITLKEDFMREYKDFIAWKELYNNTPLSKEFLREFKDEIDWTSLMTTPTRKMDEYQVEEFKNYIGWNNISVFTNISKSFIDKYRENINFDLRELLGHFNSMLDFFTGV